MIRYMHPHIFSLHSEKGLIIPFGDVPEANQKILLAQANHPPQKLNICMYTMCITSKCRSGQSINICRFGVNTQVSNRIDIFTSIFNQFNLRGASRSSKLRSKQPFIVSD